MTTQWPADHPGRNCKVCGWRVYPLWVDDEPPPGTCPDQVSHAHDCLMLRGRLVTAHGLSKHTGKPVHEQTQALMQRCGITAEHVAQWAAASDASQQAEHDLRWGKAPGSKSLGDWMREGGNARVLSIIEWALQAYDVAEGGEVNMMEMWANQETLCRRFEEMVSANCSLEPE